MGGVGKTPNIRLFVESDLSALAEVVLNREQAHYLFGVMRLGQGDSLLLFNGRDGEWEAEVAQAGKRVGTLTCGMQTRTQETPPDIWLLFAPLKKSRTDFVAEKAAELGCRRVAPVFTSFTNSGRVNVDRLQAHAVEAAEQCGLLTVPEIAEAAPLTRVLDGWDASRRLLFCDERRNAQPAMEALAAAPDGPWAVLIGPEGGFSAEEVERLRAASFVTSVSLGPRVLRADTAAVAALTLWQAAKGDWG